ncbi:MAG: Smr/MutS family protein [Saprospiraceae bacterium]
MKSTPNSINLNNLWIGDPVRIISSGKEGTFEGVGKGGKARVKHSKNMLLVLISNLEIISEAEINAKKDHLLETSPELYAFSHKKPVPTANFKNEIDLHIAKLNPSIENSHPQLILDHQLLICRIFLDFSINKKKSVVKIIHGKGTGALKEEVLHILKEYSSVRFAIEVNAGGAQEVWFKY